MTAHGFIEQLFRRPGFGMPSNVRRLTGAQLDLLVNLIGEDEDGAAVERRGGRSLVWMPAGRKKYVIAEDARGDRHTITILANVSASASGLLF